MLRSALPVLVVSLAVALPAQRSFTVPSKAATTRPGLVYDDAAPQSYPLWGTATSTLQVSRTQYLYDVNDIPVTATTLVGMGVRAPVGYTIQAGTYQTTIRVGVGPTAPTAPSSLFANNLGPSTVTVFSGSLNMPAEVTGPWPRAWQPVPFTAPAPYVAAGGPSLVVDFETSGSSHQRSWTFEGMRAEYGRANSELYQSTCLNSAGNTSSGWSWDPAGLVPGGTFQLSLDGYPQRTLSLSVNALFFGLQGQGARVGPYTTPFDLALVGAPSFPGCRWAISILGTAGYAMNYQQSAVAASLALPPGFGVTFPNTPAIAGSTIYTQNVALDTDPTSGQPTLFPSIAIRWSIGTGNTVPCARVSTISSAPRTVGGIFESEAAVLQLVY